MRGAVMPPARGRVPRLPRVAAHGSSARRGPHRRARSATRPPGRWRTRRRTPRASAGAPASWAMIAPISAIPTEPPICRAEFSTAEPTPALSLVTPLIAAAALGVITSAMPTPPISIAGSSVQVPLLDAQAREVEELRGEQRHPCAHQPARAEAVGRLPRDRRDQDDQDRHRQERRAGLHRRVAEHVLHVERDEEEDAEHRRATRAASPSSRPRTSGCGRARGRASAPADAARAARRRQPDQGDRERSRGCGRTSTRRCSPRSGRT